MQGQDAVELLKQRLGRGVNASSAFESWILGELRAAQRRLEKIPQLPQFLLLLQQPFTLTSSTETVSLPASFLRPYEPDKVYVVESTTGARRKLRKVLPENLGAKWGVEEEGFPEEYSILHKTLRVRPLPDSGTYTLYMSYYSADADIELADENLWLANIPDLVIGEAGIPLATTLRNQVALGLFTSMRDMELNRLQLDDVAREAADFDHNPED